MFSFLDLGRNVVLQDGNFQLNCKLEKLPPVLDFQLDDGSLLATYYNTPMSCKVNPNYSIHFNLLCNETQQVFSLIGKNIPEALIGGNLTISIGTHFDVFTIVKPEGKYNLFNLLNPYYFPFFG